MEVNFEQFVKFCECHLGGKKDLLKLVKKRYEECDFLFRASSEFSDLLNITEAKIISDASRFFVHLRDFLKVLKDKKSARSDADTESEPETKSRSKRLLSDNAVDETESKRIKLEDESDVGDEQNVRTSGQKVSQGISNGATTSDVCDDDGLQDDNFDSEEITGDNLKTKSGRQSSGDKEISSDHGESFTDELKILPKKQKSEGLRKFNQESKVTAKEDDTEPVHHKKGDCAESPSDHKEASGENAKKKSPPADIEIIDSDSDLSSEENVSSPDLPAFDVSSDNFDKKEFKWDIGKAKSVIRNIEGAFDETEKKSDVNVKSDKPKEIDRLVETKEKGIRVDQEVDDLRTKLKDRTDIVDKVEKMDSEVEDNVTILEDSSDEGDLDKESIKAFQNDETISITRDSVNNKYNSPSSTSSDEEDPNYRESAKKVRQKVKSKYVVSVGKKNKARLSLEDKFSGSSSSKEKGIGKSLIWTGKKFKRGSQGKKISPKKSSPKKSSPSKSPIVIVTDSDTESDDDLSKEKFEKLLERKLLKEHPVVKEKELVVKLDSAEVSPVKVTTEIMDVTKKSGNSDNETSGVDINCENTGELNEDIDIVDEFNKQTENKENETSNTASVREDMDEVKDLQEKEKGLKSIKRVPLITEEIFDKNHTKNHATSSGVEANKAFSEDSDKTDRHSKVEMNKDKEKDTTKTSDKEVDEKKGVDDQIPGPSREKEDSSSRHKKGSSRQIKKLETLLEQIRDQIEKVRMRELDLDELDDETSDYILEDKLQKKFVKVWAKLCELHDQQAATGRPTERYFRYEGTRYPDINKKIEKFINRKKVFPDFHDIRDIIIKVNKDKRLHLRNREIEDLAREAFTDVGNQLQQRRQKDFLATIDANGVNLHSSYDDPALTDIELKRKLESNKKEAKSKMDQVVEKYANLQYKVGDKTDDEEDDDDEEEEEEDDREDIGRDAETSKLLKQDTTVLNSESDEEGSNSGAGSHSSALENLNEQRTLDRGKSPDLSGMDSKEKHFFSHLNLGSIKKRKISESSDSENKSEEPAKKSSKAEGENVEISIETDEETSNESTGVAKGFEMKPKALKKVGKSVKEPDSLDVTIETDDEDEVSSASVGVQPNSLDVTLNGDEVSDSLEVTIETDEVGEISGFESEGHPPTKQPGTNCKKSDGAAVTIETDDEDSNGSLGFVISSPRHISTYDHEQLDVVEDIEKDDVSSETNSGTEVSVSESDDIKELFEDSTLSESQDEASEDIVYISTEKNTENKPSRGAKVPVPEGTNNSQCKQGFDMKKAKTIQVMDKDEEEPDVVEIISVEDPPPFKNNLNSTKTNVSGRQNSGRKEGKNTGNKLHAKKRKFEWQVDTLSSLMLKNKPQKTLQKKSPQPQVISLLDEQTLAPKVNKSEIDKKMPSNKQNSPVSGKPSKATTKTQEKDSVEVICLDEEVSMSDSEASESLLDTSTATTISGSVSDEVAKATTNENKDNIPVISLDNEDENSDSGDSDIDKCPDEKSEGELDEKCQEDKECKSDSESLFSKEDNSSDNKGIDEIESSENILQEDNYVLDEASVSDEINKSDVQSKQTNGDKTCLETVENKTIAKPLNNIDQEDKMKREESPVMYFATKVQLKAQENGDEEEEMEYNQYNKETQEFDESMNVYTDQTLVDEDFDELNTDDVLGDEHKDIPSDAETVENNSEGHEKLSDMDGTPELISNNETDDMCSKEKTVHRSISNETESDIFMESLEQDSCENFESLPDIFEDSQEVKEKVELKKDDKDNVKKHENDEDNVEIEEDSSEMETLVDEEIEEELGDNTIQTEKNDLKNIKKQESNRFDEHFSSASSKAIISQGNINENYSTNQQLSDSMEDCAIKCEQRDDSLEDRTGAESYEEDSICKQHSHAADCSNSDSADIPSTSDDSDHVTKARVKLKLPDVRNKLLRLERAIKTRHKQKSPVKGGSKSVDMTEGDHMELIESFVEPATSASITGACPASEPVIILSDSD